MATHMDMVLAQEKLKRDALTSLKIDTKKLQPWNNLPKNSPNLRTLHKFTRTPHKDKNKRIITTVYCLNGETKVVKLVEFENVHLPIEAQADEPAWCRGARMEVVIGPQLNAPGIIKARPGDVYARFNDDGHITALAFLMPKAWRSSGDFWKISQAITRLVSIVVQLHREGVWHLDIAPKNLLFLSAPDSPIQPQDLHLIDLGNALPVTQPYRGKIDISWDFSANSMLRAFWSGAESFTGKDDAIMTMHVLWFFVFGTKFRRGQNDVEAGSHHTNLFNGTAAVTIPVAAFPPALKTHFVNFAFKMITENITMEWLTDWAEAHERLWMEAPEMKYTLGAMQFKRSGEGMEELTQSKKPPTAQSPVSLSRKGSLSSFQRFRPPSTLQSVPIPPSALPNPTPTTPSAPQKSIATPPFKESTNTTTSTSGPSSRGVRMAHARHPHHHTLTSSSTHSSQSPSKRDSDAPDALTKQAQTTAKLMGGSTSEETKAGFLSKSGERDISEKIALGRAQPTLSKESMFDQRLFNQSAGLSSGFGDEDSYNLYDKSLPASSSSAATHSPGHSAKDDNNTKGVDERVERLLVDDAAIARTEGGRKTGGWREGPEGEASEQTSILFNNAQVHETQSHSRDSAPAIKDNARRHEKGLKAQPELCNFTSPLPELGASPAQDASAPAQDNTPPVEDASMSALPQKAVNEEHAASGAGQEEPQTNPRDVGRPSHGEKEPTEQGGPAATAGVGGAAGVEDNKPANEDDEQAEEEEEETPAGVGAAMGEGGDDAVGDEAEAEPEGEPFVEGGLRNGNIIVLSHVPGRFDNCDAEACNYAHQLYDKARTRAVELFIAHVNQALLSNPDWIHFETLEGKRLVKLRHLRLDTGAMDYLIKAREGGTLWEHLRLCGKSRYFDQQNTYTSRTIYNFFNKPKDVGGFSGNSVVVTLLSFLVKTNDKVKELSRVEVRDAVEGLAIPDREDGDGEDGLSAENDADKKGPASRTRSHGPVKPE
ncbi:mRNA splicing protein [Rhizophlyctis rosea]|nr:mRNA splicing protein [Rhizophlyctis rosea]